MIEPMKTRMPIGISDFQQLREGNFAFIDKSLFIEEVMLSGAQVLLLPRPRRFGKTLNLSMLRYFLDITQDTTQLFEGLLVTQNKAVMRHRQGYPVVHLSFKDLKATTIAGIQERLAVVLSKLYNAHREAVSQGLEAKTAHELDTVDHILKGTATPAMLERGLDILIRCLWQYHGQKKVVVLIDEYDVPIQATYATDDFDQTLQFMRNFLGAALKDNPLIEKCVLTGILRVAKESIFSGLNHIKTASLLSPYFSSAFGFTQAEVHQLLKSQGLLQHETDVTTWYNGYRFGETTVYNPWSILNFVDTPKQGLMSYWVNTSDNDLIRRLVLQEQGLQRHDLARLLQGEAVYAVLDEHINLRDLDRRALWSLLLFAGYLKPTDSKLKANGEMEYGLMIPNREVMIFFSQTMARWLEGQWPEARQDALLEALMSLDFARFERELSELIIRVVSYHDTTQHHGEAFYHAFFLGLLLQLRERFRLSSNREAGLGRYDLALTPHQPGGVAFIFEFKVATSQMDLAETAEAALDQIDKRQYMAEASNAGAQQAIAVGVAFRGKEIAIKHREYGKAHP